MRSPHDVFIQSQNEYIEEHIKRHGRRMDHEERKYVPATQHTSYYP